MGRLIILSILFFSCIHTNAQDTAVQFHYQKTFAGNFTDFTVDEMGNILLVINNAQIKKISRIGDSIAVYNDVKRYGNIHSVNAANPFKILVFYKSTGTIVILDRLLAVKQVIELRKNNILQPKSISQSYDNNIWVFDELDNKIKKIDDNGKLLLESADLRNVFPEAPSFEYVFDDNRSLYLYDPNQGWFTFDYYGAFKRKYAFTSWKDVQVKNERFTGRDDSTVFFADAGGFNFSRVKTSISFKTAVKVYYDKKTSYILYPGKLEIYDAP